MKNSLTFLLLFFTFPVFAQNFPQELRLSADGTRLQLGGHTTTGFYDESEIRVIELSFPSDNFFAQLTAAGDNDNGLSGD